MLTNQRVVLFDSGLLQEVVWVRPIANLDEHQKGDVTYFVILVYKTKMSSLQNENGYLMQDAQVCLKHEPEPVLVSRQYPGD